MGAVYRESKQALACAMHVGDELGGRFEWSWQQDLSLMYEPLRISLQVLAHNTMLCLLLWNLFVIVLTLSPSVILAAM